MTFWNELPRPFFVLAPMEAVTDVVFRHVVKAAAAPDVFFTEFTNATGWVHAGDKAIGTRLVRTPDETNVIAQLWGSVPEDMTKMAQRCAELGFEGIDINMGCPDSHAIKSGGGAAMCHTPELAGQMIASAKESGLPVSVKCRLGYSSVEEWREWIGFLLQQDIVNLTVHLRTKKEMSKVPAHYELIPEIKNLRDELAPQTLLTINGDVEDRAHGEELAAKYGVDGIMIGRGIFHNPFAFHKGGASPSALPRNEFEATAPPPKARLTARASIAADASAGPAGNVDRKEQLLNLLKLQLDLHDEYHKIQRRNFDPLKRFFKIYVRDFEGAAELRDKLMHTKSTDEVRALIG